MTSSPVGLFFCCILLYTLRRYIYTLSREQELSLLYCPFPFVDFYIIFRFLTNAPQNTVITTSGARHAMFHSTRWSLRSQRGTGRTETSLVGGERGASRANRGNSPWRVFSIIELARHLIALQHRVAEIAATTKSDPVIVGGGGSVRVKVGGVWISGVYCV